MTFFPQITFPLQAMDMSRIAPEPTIGIGWHPLASLHKLPSPLRCYPAPLSESAHGTRARLTTCKRHAVSSFAVVAWDSGVHGSVGRQIGKCKCESMM